MEVKIEKDTDNKLFGRKEMVFSASYKGKTPTQEEVKEEICKKLSLSPDLTVVVKISPLFGTSAASVLVHSYSSKEAMSVEKKHLFERITKKSAKAVKATEAKSESKAEPKEQAKQAKEEKAAE
ncbi:MAG: hypothetical protein KGH61_00035 [Candidatus Micrarchaeota archaeon]|nr:hypothetical protein [Candidatus Micrarchaeota archaeon]MDE1847325.1 hypothetical protein [Candidatus Micrarchaeota archaeon]MDE1863940.1 hypothetical protein [Candidatus Micrarchaeota archaeon]